jgi:hypothetical protein
MFEKNEYERLSKISVSHIYNLRGKRQYLSGSLTYTKTQATRTAIGERRKPGPEGKPGYIRVRISLLICLRILPKKKATTITPP